MISIVTVCYNAQNVIEKTIQSVLKQKNCDFEYIFVDGQSSDKTLSIIKSYKCLFEKKGIKVVICSEKDNGIYDAMNKGVSLASGEWINFLNAGDVYFDCQVLDNVQKKIREIETDVLVGEVILVEGYLGLRQRNRETRFLEKEMIFCHQAIFTRRDLLARRPYDTKYHYSADYEWMLWAFYNQYRILVTQEKVAYYDAEGASSKNRNKTLEEAAEIRRQYKIILDDFCEINNGTNYKYKLYKILCKIKPFAYIVYRWMKLMKKEIYWLTRG